MGASQESQISSSFNSFYNQTMPPQVHQYSFSSIQALNNGPSPTVSRSQGTEVSLKNPKQFFTFESNPATDFAPYSSPSAASVSSNRSPFSPQVSHYSYASDPHHSSDNTTYGSPVSGISENEDENKLMHALWVLRNELLGPESDTDDSCSFDGSVMQPTSFTKYNRILEMAPQMDLKKLLVACAETVAESHTFSQSDRQVALSAAEALLEILEKKISVCGDPLQRLGAYMLEGIKARLLQSGSIIYKKLKCKEPINPTGSELMSYMGVLYQICPYYKFAYMSANLIIEEAMAYEKRIHIIDFQIAQGSQWVSFIQSISHRSGEVPYVRITGIDDSESAYARGGGLQLVGQKLAQVAKSCGVPFEFHGAAISGTAVQLENLGVRDDEALAVNFPYFLHHMPDESVSTDNHRDRLLRLVKSLSPKVMTLVEQESNTNTSTFLQRFCETLDYYTAMFESIDAARPRNDRQRISAEEHCVAKDVVNIIACEGPERVERHEPFGKWRSRLAMAGFSQLQLNPTIAIAIRDMLKEHSSNYRIGEGNGALYLGWKNRAMSTASAWR